MNVTETRIAEADALVQSTRATHDAEYERYEAAEQRHTSRAAKDAAKAKADLLWDEASRAIKAYNALIEARNLAAERAGLLSELIRADHAHDRARYGIEGDVEVTAKRVEAVKDAIDDAIRAEAEAYLNA